MQFLGEFGWVFGVDFGEEFGRGFCALEEFEFFGSADDEPEDFLVGVVEDLAELVWADENGAERGNGQGFVANAHASGALEDDVKLFLTDVFVEGVGAFWRQPPKARGEILRPGALEIIGIRDLHQVGGAPLKILGID